MKKIVYGTIGAAFTVAVGGASAYQAEAEPSAYMFWKDPANPAAYAPCILLIFALLSAAVTVKSLLSKPAEKADVAAVDTNVRAARDDIAAVNDQAVENRTIVQGEAAKTRQMLRDEFAKLTDGMAPEEKKSFEDAIAELLESTDARKAPAQDAIRERRVIDAGDHLMKVAAQTSAAADDFAKETLDTYREAAALFYPVNTDKAVAAYKKCIERGDDDAWSYIYLARLYRRGGQTGEALSILTAVQTSSLSLRDAMVVASEKGNILIAQGDLIAARAQFTKALSAAETLADQSPQDADYQRDLSVSYNKLGDVAVAQGDLTAALGYYSDGLTVAKALAAGDRSNAVYQRDLSASYFKLARMGGDDAPGYWRNAYATLKALDDAGRMNPADQTILDMLAAEVAKLDP